MVHDREVDADADSGRHTAPLEVNVLSRGRSRHLVQGIALVLNNEKTML